jgi:hypothetical protein
LEEIGGPKLLAASLEYIIRVSGPPDGELIETIRYRLSLAPEKRLNCLRRKIGLRATSL